MGCGAWGVGCVAWGVGCGAWGVGRGARGAQGGEWGVGNTVNMWRVARRVAGRLLGWVWVGVERGQREGNHPPLRKVVMFMQNSCLEMMVLAVHGSQS